MATKQLIHCGTGYGVTLSKTAVTYYPALYGMGSLMGQATEINYCGSIVPTGGTLSKWSIKLTGAPGAGKSWTFLLRKNGADTDLTITISGTATTGQDNSHSAVISAGDILHVKITPSDDDPDATTPALWAFEWVPTTDGEYIYGGNTGNALASANNFFKYSASAPSATENLCRIICPLDGTWKKLSLLAQLAPGAGKNYYLTARENGSDQSLVANIANTATYNCDTTNSFTSAPGDIVTFQLTTVGSPFTYRFAWAVVFDPADDGNCFAPGLTSVALNTGSNQYCGFAGILALSTNVDTQPGFSMSGFNLSGLYVALSAAPGAGKSYAFTMRHGGADQDISATVADAATIGNDTGSIIVADFDDFGIQSVPSGTPTGSYLTTSLIYSSSSASAPYDDGTPDGGIVFGGEVVEVATVDASDGISSGGIVLGGPSTSETEPDEVHQVDGAAIGGVVFGGSVPETWTAEPNNWVAVKPGTYRIGGALYTLAETMTYEGLGAIGALVNCGEPPAVAGRYRYDVLSIDTAGAITVTAGAESTTPVMPSTPANEVRLNHVLRYAGQVTILQADIGKLWTAPAFTVLEIAVTDDELAWAEASTAITATCRDQYGQLYTGGKSVNASIISGNGAITPATRSGTGSSFAFTYTREQELTDVSPLIELRSPSGPFATAFIQLLDSDGDLMT